MKLVRFFLFIYVFESYLFTKVVISRNVINYSEQESWKFLKDAKCGGNLQSPINIITRKALINSRLNLKLYNYLSLSKDEYMIKNEGNTVNVILTKNKTRPSLSGSATQNKLHVLEKFHIHWGNQSNLGSEHSLDGKKFSGEIHFVFKNVNYNIQQAFREKDGIVVIGVWLELSSHAPYLVSIVEAVNQTQASELVQPQHDLNLSNFFPFKKDEFYKYFGSLTTPNCNEVITWIIFKHTNKITEKQLETFRNLNGYGPNMRIPTNIRNLQPLNNRIVQQTDDQILNKISWILIVFTFLVLMSKNIAFNM